MVGGTESQPAGPAGGGTKQPDCVLWRPPGTEAPPRLLASLKRRGVAITDCTSPMLAMATACRLARLRRKGADEAPPGEDGVILLLAHPAQLEMAAEVVEAIETTVGAVACWRYDDQDRAAALRAVTPEDVAGWRAAREPDPDPEPEAEALRPVIVGIPAEEVAPRRRDGAAASYPGPRMPAGAQPTLRLVGDEPEPAPSRDLDEEEPADMPEEPDPGTLLTEEELMMLLSSDPTEWEAEPDREES